MIGSDNSSLRSELSTINFQLLTIDQNVYVSLIRIKGTNKGVHYEYA